MKEETRDRLLRATAELLEESGDPPSTRAICGRAGVTAPTLYHHFGNKQALIDAVIGYGLTQYPIGPAGDDDPIAAVRAGWDAHVRYGLANPTFYVLVHGRIRAGVPCAVVVPAQPALESLFAEAARRGLLRVPVTDAAARVLAANIGVTLSLIGQPEDARDPLLSSAVREAVLTSILAAESTGAASHVPGAGKAAGAGGQIPTSRRTADEDGRFPAADEVAGAGADVPAAGNRVDAGRHLPAAGEGAAAGGRIPAAGEGAATGGGSSVAGEGAAAGGRVPAAGVGAAAGGRVPAAGVGADAGGGISAAGEGVDAGGRVPAAGEGVDAGGRVPAAGEGAAAGGRVLPAAGGRADAGGGISAAGEGAATGGRIPAAGEGGDGGFRVPIPARVADAGDRTPSAGRMAHAGGRARATATGAGAVNRVLPSDAGSPVPVPAERTAGGTTGMERTTGKRTDRASRAQAAVTLRAALTDDPSGLTQGEAVLLSELLDRLGRQG